MKCYIYHIPLLIAAMLAAGCDNIFSGNEEGTVTLTLSTQDATIYSAVTRKGP